MDPSRPPDAETDTETDTVTAPRTAVGRARGRHRALLIATCAALISASIADAATGYDGPGPLVYPVFALAVALIPWRHTPLLAAAMSVFFIVGGLASASFVHRLTAPNRLLDFTAGWAQMLSFVAAAAFAMASVACAARSTPPRPTHP